MFESIPQELKFDALWCCWKKTENGKVPYNPVTGTLAKSNDKRTFCSFKTMLNNIHKYLKQDDSGALLGGMGLGIFNGFSAVDIDHCIDDNGVISDMAQEIIDYCQSYTEYSPSGKGIRIIFKTDFTNFDKKLYYTNNRKSGLEIYIEKVTNKFVTITGNAILNCDIATVDIEPILDKYMKKKTTTNENTTVICETDGDISKFLKIDTKLSELWHSKASGSGGNESETDLALCNKLAFYLQKDPEAINNAFMSSPYFMTKDNKHKDKWLEREDYRESTIELAISSCNEIYNPNYKSNKQKVYSLTDTGNAHRFVDKFGTDIKYNKENKCWMIWNGSYWQPDVFDNIKNLAEILTEEMKIEAFSYDDLDKQKEAIKNVNKMFNSNGKEKMIKESQHLSGIPVVNDMFDKNDFLFNCEEGVVDLRSGAILEHNRNLLLSKFSNVNVGHKAPTLFLKFLDEIFMGDQELIHYIHKALGYSMTGSTKEQVMFLCIGDGANGKSLLLQIIQEVLGDYSASSDIELLLDKNTQTSNLSEVARLKGIRMVVTGESKLGDKLNESRIKSLTGGNDKITARFLYANEFEFYPKMKIWVATNHAPIIRGTDNGIWRRIVKIPFNRIFKEEEQDKDLIFKLRKEKNEILNWLIAGCLLWQKEGLKEPEVLKNEKKEYRTELDLVQKWLDENCETGSVNYYEKTTDLYQNFKAYCEKNGEFKMSQTLFSRNIGKKFRKERMSGTYVYIGVRLKSDV